MPMNSMLSPAPAQELFFIRCAFHLVVCLLLSLLRGIKSCQSEEDDEEEDKEKTFEVSSH